MTSVPTDDDEKLAPGRIVAAIIFALLALAFFAVTVVYMITPASGLPGFLGGGPNSQGHHSVRGAGTFIIGLAFVGAAWFAVRYRSLALEAAREADRAAALAEAEQAPRVEASTVEASTVEASTVQAGSVQASIVQADTVQSGEA